MQTHSHNDTQSKLTDKMIVANDLNPGNDKC